MRSEREIIAEVLDAARQDAAVRVVIRTDLVPEREYLYKEKRRYPCCREQQLQSKQNQPVLFNHSGGKING